MVFLSSNLSKSSVMFLNTISSVANNDIKLMSVSAAVAIARTLPMPTPEPESASAFYANTYYLVVSDLVGSLNEQIIIDPTLTIKIVKDMWLSRFQMAFCNKMDDAIEGDFHGAVYGGRSFVDPQTLELIRRNAKDVHTLAVGFVNVLNELKRPNTQETA